MLFQLIFPTSLSLRLARAQTHFLPFIREFYSLSLRRYCSLSTLRVLVYAHACHKVCARICATRLLLFLLSFFVLVSVSVHGFEVIHYPIFVRCNYVSLFFSTFAVFIFSLAHNILLNACSMFMYRKVAHWWFFDIYHLQIINVDKSILYLSKIHCNQCSISNRTIWSDP